MNSGEERDITTATPAESQPDESNRVPSDTHDTDEAGTDAARGAPSGEDAGEGNRAGEIGGRTGPDPVRYGDWEKKGRCIDF
ncbi:MAG: DUF1674 domain-containing protein [Gammaproteobacteria bacterium]|nr:DUF1674 domain-containing protein [Gammaproteobacteria bacterium]